MADLTAGWQSDGTIPDGGGSDPKFIAWMQKLASDQFDTLYNTWKSGNGANFAQGQTDGSNGTKDTRDTGATIGPHDLASAYQELGEGKQGASLYAAYKSGLTTDAINAAYSKGSDNAATAASLPVGMGLSSEPALSADQQKFVTDNGYTYVPGSSGNPDSGTQDTPGHWEAAAGGRSGGVPQPLLEHGTQNDADTGAFWFDPNSGFRTSTANVNVDGTGIGGWLANGGVATLISAALTAGAGLAISTVGQAALAAGAVAGDVGVPTTGTFGTTHLLGVPGLGQTAGNLLTGAPDAAAGAAGDGLDRWGNPVGSAKTNTNTDTSGVPSLDGSTPGVVNAGTTSPDTPGFQIVDGSTAPPPATTANPNASTTTVTPIDIPALTAGIGKQPDTSGIVNTGAGGP